MWRIISLLFYCESRVLSLANSVVCIFKAQLSLWVLLIKSSVSRQFVQVSSFVAVHVNLNPKRRIALRFLGCILNCRLDLLPSVRPLILPHLVHFFPSYITLTYGTAKRPARIWFHLVLWNFSPPILHKYSLLLSSMNTLDCFALFQVWQTCILHNLNLFFVHVSASDGLLFCATCWYAILFHYYQLHLFLYLPVICFCVFRKGLFFASIHFGQASYFEFDISWVVTTCYVFLSGTRFDSESAAQIICKHRFLKILFYFNHSLDFHFNRDQFFFCVSFVHCFYLEQVDLILRTHIAAALLQFAAAHVICSVLNKNILYCSNHLQTQISEILF